MQEEHQNVLFEIECQYPHFTAQHFEPNLLKLIFSYERKLPIHIISYITSSKAHQINDLSLVLYKIKIYSLNKIQYGKQRQ